MGASKSAQSVPITFVGALPPPVTGMTALTQAVVAALEARTTVRRYNWSRGKPMKGWPWRLARNWGALKSIAALIAHGPARGATLYYPVSCGAGLLFDNAIAATARLMGYRLLLHHHSYLYIDRYDRRLALLDRLAGAGGTHVVHCPLMRDDFQRRYKSRASFLFVPPTIVSHSLETPPTPTVDRDSRLFTIGFLSNLAFSKGLDDVIATFEQLLQHRPNVRLILAGPCMGSKERKLVDDALARRPDRVEYRGPAYGADKSRFFADIDAFVLPTRNESWGIVLSESLASSRPVIARAHGCVSWIIRGGCGLAISPQADFVAAAVELLTQWIDHPAQYLAAREAATRRAAELDAEARRYLAEFLDAVVPDAHEGAPAPARSAALATAD